MVNRMVKYNTTIDTDQQRRLLVSDPKPPLLYGLPKIHKDNFPLRPIVSSINSPTYNVSKFISKQLMPFVGKTSSYIKDSYHFIHLLKDLKIDDHDLLVSFDVESLFTMVPIPETVDIIKELLDPDMADLAKLCLESTYFCFDGEFFEQTNGAAMGSPLSPVAANLYMEQFETFALESAVLKPKVWYRYIDDVYAIWPHGETNLENFLSHLNSIHGNIKFTMEKEKNHQLPFLDVMTIKKPDGTLGHSVYRKPTHTNRYLHSSSHHHPSHKNSVLSSLINRAIRISDEDHLQEEKLILDKALQQNGYSSNNINKVFKKQLDRAKTQGQLNQAGTSTQNPENPKKVYLPYVKGTSEKMGKIFHKYNIKPIYRPMKKIKEFLRPVKDQIPLSSSGVYRVPCGCGAVYVGQTKRMISTRMKEHIRHTKNEDVDKSALAEHSCITKHAIVFEDTKQLAREDHYLSRIVREAIEIKKHPNNLNHKENSYKLSQSWTPLFKMMKTVI